MSDFSFSNDIDTPDRALAALEALARIAVGSAEAEAAENPARRATAQRMQKALSSSRTVLKQHLGIDQRQGNDDKSQRPKLSVV